MFKAKVDSWKCEPDDTVVFVLKPGIKFIPGKIFWGRVVKRVGSDKVIVATRVLVNRKLVAKVFTVHVFCVIVTKQALKNTRHGKIAAANDKKKEDIRQEWLNSLRKKQQAKKGRLKKVKKTKVNAIGGMTFKY